MSQVAIEYGIVIPSYEPDEKLIELVKRIDWIFLDHVVVVDDGSVRPGTSEVFSECENIGVTVIHHEKNAGKGSAIKTGIRHLLDMGCNAVVTADCDGQHAPDDIRKVAHALNENPRCLVMGVRDTAEMPPRSVAGNKMTRTLLRLLYGIKLQDAMTGLRGIPLHHADDLLALDGKQGEHDMQMLVNSSRLFDGIVEVPIKTIYFDNNAGSHFNPMTEGVIIYGVIFRSLPKFIVSSVGCSLFDLALYGLLYHIAGIMAFQGAIISRVVAGTANFLINKFVVFKGASKDYNAVRYIALALVILAASSSLVYVLVDTLGLPAVLTKIIIDCVLFLVSYSVQNKIANRR